MYLRTFKCLKATASQVWRLSFSRTFKHSVPCRHIEDEQHTYSGPLLDMSSRSPVKGPMLMQSKGLPYQWGGHCSLGQRGSQFRLQSSQSPATLQSASRQFRPALLKPLSEPCVILLAVRPLKPSYSTLCLLYQRCVASALVIVHLILHTPRNMDALKGATCLKEAMQVGGHTITNNAAHNN